MLENMTCPAPPASNSAQAICQVRRQTGGPAVRGNDRNHHMGGNKQIIAAEYILIEHNTRAFQACKPCPDLHNVVNRSRLAEVQVHGPHGKGQRLTGYPCLELSVMDPGKTQKIGAPALEKAHISAVINDAGEIRIFIIDADRQDMNAIVKTAGKIGPGGHRSLQTQKS